MQKYRPKTPAAAVSDRLLRIGVTTALGIGWFVCLWGLSLPAVTAGTALGALIWLCVRQFSKQVTQKREMQMRRMIGGELAIMRLLLESPRKAAFQCALWIAPRYPLEIHSAQEWHVSGIWNGQKTFMRLIAQHPHQKITPQQILECAREAHEAKAQQTILCLTAPAEAEALSYAAGLDPPMRIIGSAELTELAGYANPASDEDLRKIGKQKRTRRSAQEWLAVILDLSHARRYFWYGIGLSLLAPLTGSGYYPLPAAVCLILYTGCKIRQAVLSRRRRWTG